MSLPFISHTGPEDEQIDDDIAIEGGGAQLAPNAKCPITMRAVLELEEPVQDAKGCGTAFCCAARCCCNIFFGRRQGGWGLLLFGAAVVWGRRR